MYAQIKSLPGASVLVMPGYDHQQVVLRQVYAGVHVTGNHNGANQQRDMGRQRRESRQTQRNHREVDIIKRICKGIAEVIQREWEFTQFRVEQRNRVRHQVYRAVMR